MSEHPRGGSRQDPETALEAERNALPKTAVAIHYEQGSGQAPRVTAKGEGEVAERIIAAAQEAGVPIEDNPLLAIALSQVDLDETIPEDLYSAVAEVIRFVLKHSGELGGTTPHAPS